jgi:DNA-binding transcriptional LysR family regulator
MDLNQMFLFVRVVQAGSFSAAARQLAVPKSTLSRKVSELEERLGVRLLQRTTRKLGLTDAGRVYFDQAAQVVAGAQEAEQAVGSLQAAPRGLLRVTAPMSFAILAPVLTEYLTKHDDVQIEVVCTDRRVDIVAEGFDLAIRAGPMRDSSLVARSLGVHRLVLVASPAYCREHGTPRAPRDLARHTCIAFMAAPHVWALEAEGERVEVRVSPRLTVNDLDILAAAAVDGLGIALMPEFVCVEDVRKKRLQRLLPEWCSAAVPLHAVYPTARHLSPKVAAFVELVRSKLRFNP